MLHASFTQYITDFANRNFSIWEIYFREPNALSPDEVQLAMDIMINIVKRASVGENYYVHITPIPESVIKCFTAYFYTFTKEGDGYKIVWKYHAP